MKTLVGLAFFLFLIVVVWAWVAVPEAHQTKHRNSCANVDTANPVFCDGGPQQ